MKIIEKDIINRIKRAEGQLRGIQRMIEEDQECLAIVTQLSAVRSSINSVMGLVIGQKVNDCIENPSDDVQEQERRIEEAIRLIVKK